MDFRDAGIVPQQAGKPAQPYAFRSISDYIGSTRTPIYVSPRHSLPTSSSVYLYRNHGKRCNGIIPQIPHVSPEKNVIDLAVPLANGTN